MDAALSESRLQISYQKPRNFYERAARERYASGADYVVITALGNAIITAVMLADSLVSKKVGTLSKVETTYDGNSEHAGLKRPTPGIKITVMRHAEFRGTRIPPSMVLFSTKPEKGYTPPYEETPEMLVGSVNAGDFSLIVGMKGMNQAFADVLGKAGQDVSKYDEIHKSLLEQCVKEYGSVEAQADVRLLKHPDSDSVKHPDLLASFCRLCFPLKDKPVEAPGVPHSTGAVFIDIFEKEKRPHSQENNFAMVYVVGPKGSQFGSSTEFLEAVQHTGVNIMTALCDFNGHVRRTKKDDKSLGKMEFVRVCLVSGGEFMHTDATKNQVAESLFQGMAQAYRHRLSPKISFTRDDDAFPHVWESLTGRVLESGTAE